MICKIAQFSTFKNNKGKSGCNILCSLAPHTHCECGTLSRISSVTEQVGYNVFINTKSLYVMFCLLCNPN